MEPSIEESLRLLGREFRGLWRSVLANSEGIKNKENWAVTIALEKTMVETEYFDTAEGALYEAVLILHRFNKNKTP